MNTFDFVRWKMGLCHSHKFELIDEFTYTVPKIKTAHKAMTMNRFLQHLVRQCWAHHLECQHLDTFASFTPTGTLVKSHHRECATLIIVNATDDIIGKAVIIRETTDLDSRGSGMPLSSCVYSVKLYRCTVDR